MRRKNHHNINICIVVLAQLIHIFDKHNHYCTLAFRKLLWRGT